MRISLAFLFSQQFTVFSVMGSSNRAQDFVAYHPNNTFKIYIDMQENNLRTMSKINIRGLAFKKMTEKTGLSASDLHISSQHQDTYGVYHFYMQQLYHGIPIDNQHAGIHINSDGHVFAISSSISSTTAQNNPRIFRRKTRVSLNQAIQIAIKRFKIPRDAFPPTSAYLRSPNGKLVHTYEFQLRDDKQSKWYLVRVDSNSGKIVTYSNYFSDAKTRIKVLKLPIESGGMEDFEIFDTPDKSTYSPIGWGYFAASYGNNVHVSLGDIKKVKGMKSPKTIEDAMVINVFYITNMLHDIFYAHGFDEQAGNFQTDNFKKGGLEQDNVIVVVQIDADGYLDDATMAAPPDGQPGLLKIGKQSFKLLDQPTAFDNTVLIHEYTHGLSARLTGGALAQNCLSSREAKGLGEGCYRQPFKEFAIGSYMTKTVMGFRKNYYTSDQITNKLKFSSLKGLSIIHDIGEVWASVLWEVYWNLVETYGFTLNWFDKDLNKGNIAMIKIIILGMKVQPCNPTFLEARDAILVADNIIYREAHKCAIWKGFAQRGMGTNAKDVFIDGFDVPAECNA